MSRGANSRLCRAMFVFIPSGERAPFALHLIWLKLICVGVLLSFLLHLRDEISRIFIFRRWALATDGRLDERTQSVGPFSSCDVNHVTRPLKTLRNASSTSWFCLQNTLRNAVLFDNGVFCMLFNRLVTFNARFYFHKFILLLRLTILYIGARITFARTFAKEEDNV